MFILVMLLDGQGLFCRMTPEQSALKPYSCMVIIVGFQEVSLVLLLIQVLLSFQKDTLHGPGSVATGVFWSAGQVGEDMKQSWSTSIDV